MYDDDTFLDFDPSDPADIDDLMALMRELGNTQLNRLQQMISHMFLEIRTEDIVEWRNQPWAIRAGLGYPAECKTEPTEIDVMPFSVEEEKYWGLPTHEMVGVKDINVEFVIKTNYHEESIYDMLDTSHSHTISSLDCCKASIPTSNNPVWVNCAGQTVSLANYPASTKSITKEDAMYTENQTKVNYLSARLEDVFYPKNDDLYNTFNMRNVKPKNAKQAKEWLAGGGFVIEAEKDEDSYFSSYWQDPAKPRNPEGFKNASKLLAKDYQDARDAIKIYDPAEGLKVLQAFESKTYH